jgi:2-dehydropantoate 2-reductase
VRICVYGIGAIGGLLAARLAEGEADVVCIARGATLAAVQARGLTILSGETTKNIRIRAVETPAEAGVQDYVILALKAPAATAVADKIGPLLGPDTAVVTAQNGVPWWYFYKHGGRFDGRRLASVDPGDTQWRHIGPERVIGTVVYDAAEIAEPGTIRHEYGDRLSLGEPDGSRSARAEVLSKLLIAGGVRAPVRTNIRDEIWVKLWGNVSFNPVSALTGMTLGQMIDDPAVHAIIRAMMVEAQQVAEALGIRFAIDVDKRIAGAREAGDHKTSMLQDLEAGRALEIDVLVASVQELGRMADVATPAIDAILALVRARARIASDSGL